MRNPNCNLKSIIFNLTFAICYLLSAICSAQVTQEWVNRFTWNNSASGRSVKLDNSGNVYVLLRLFADSTLEDYGLVKYNSSGKLLWSTYYNGPANLSDRAEAFAVTGSGDVYITGGTSDINSANRIATVKYNSDGVLQWAKVFDGGGTGDGVRNISLDNSGNIIVIGASSIGGGTAYGLIIKYNSSGDTLWARKFNQLPRSSAYFGIYVDNSNNIYTTGYYSIPPFDYLITKYNENGNLIWYTLYNSDPQNYSDIGYFVAMDTNKKIYVVGSTSIPGASLNNNLIKLDSNGVIQWARIFTGVLSGNGRCESQPMGLIVTTDGNSIYYITSCYNNLSGTDIVTLKYLPSGDTSWVRRYNGGGGFGTRNVPAALKLDIEKNIYVSGFGNYAVSGNDYVTIKYLTNGNQQWLASYNGPLTNSNDGASDLVIDTYLNLFVTGTSSRQNNPYLIDAATIKYSQIIGISKQNNEQPEKFKLYQNYPNPFNSYTIITYELPERCYVELKLFSYLGQYIISLVRAVQNEGYYSILFNDEELSTGVYFLSLLSDNSIIETKKLILLK